jgi:hypothetical protein
LSAIFPLTTVPVATCMVKWYSDPDENSVTNITTS